MNRYRLTPAAREDLLQIRSYLRKRSPDAARRVLEALRDAMEKLAEQPGTGHLREDLADEPLRFWSVYSYLIIYRAEPGPLQVVRVLHGAQDVNAILQQEDQTGN